MANTDDETLVEEFKKTGQLPLTWQWMARQFICAANTLQERREREDSASGHLSNSNRLWNIQTPMLMLYGLALENLLKGLLVAQGVDATSTGKLNKQLKTHDLRHLWTLAKLPADDEEIEELLIKLRWTVEPGKYPVGTKPDPDEPFPVKIALTDVRQIAEVLETVEDKLREVSSQAFRKTDLLSLCRQADKSAR